MDNLLSNELLKSKNEKKISLAYFGETKCGKTTGIAALTNIPEQIIKLASGDNGRTKTTVQYHIVAQLEKNTIIIENIELFELNILGSYTGDVNKYNEQLKKNSILKKVFGLSELTEKDNVKEYVLDKVKQLENVPISLTKLKELMCSEKIDNFIRRLTVKVPAQDNIAKYLKMNNVDLFIRDTRGLLDIALQDNNGKNQTSKSLRELGLEDLDGIVFFCSNSYPNIIQDLYKDTFESVFKSVPVFLIDRVEMLFEIFKMNNQPTNYTNIKSLIDSIQNGEHPLCTNIETKFYPTFELMEHFDITRVDKQACTVSFKDTFFNQQKVEFLLPNCNSLTTLSIFDKNIENEFKDSEDFLFYQLMSVVSCIKMLNMICKLQDSMQLLLQGSVASDYLWNVYTSNNTIALLEKDFNLYDNSRGSTTYVRPQFDSITSARIKQDIDDVNIELLGSRGGITTLNNGKLRYPTTAVTAVTSRKWISMLISKIKVTSDLKKPNSNDLLFENLKGNIPAQGILLRNTLYSVLYKKFTDVDATIQYYLIIDRYKVVEGIKSRRKNKSTPYTSFTEAVQNVLEEFCNYSSKQTINKVSDVFKDNDN